MDFRLHQDADREGEAARNAGQSRDVNPYKPGTEQWEYWDAAWVATDVQIAVDESEVSKEQDDAGTEPL